MKVEYINPFIESVYNLFSTMLGSEAKRGNVALYKGGGTYDVTVLIGISGPARGTVAMAFPLETAAGILNRLLGIEVSVVDDTVTDGLSEVVNIVAGGAKSKLSDAETPLNLSLPTVVRGNHYQVEYPKGSVWLEVPFESDLGSFSMRVTFESGKA